MASSPIARFWPKTVQQGTCLIWTGARKRDRHGSRSYGFFHDGTKIVLAHRFIYERCIGPLNDNVLMHSCDNPACVALQHLSPGTQAQNVADCVAKGRNVSLPRQSHCSRGHALDDANTYVKPNGSRSCRACAEASRERYRAKEADRGR